MRAISNGVAQVFLVESPIAGWIFILGLLIAGRRTVGLGVAGAVIALLAAYVSAQNYGMIINGAYAFNSVLTAIAVGPFVMRLSWESVAWLLGGIVAAFGVFLWFAHLLDPFFMPVLTAPFVVTTWAMDAVKNKRTADHQRPPIPLSDLST